MNNTARIQERLGTKIKGQWTLERLLGSGGMAAVYVGVNEMGHRHAIKILHPNIANSEEVRARFEQEAHVVNLLRHPGAVEIQDFSVSEDGCPFLVMELLEGETLAQHLTREQEYDLQTLLSIADQTLEVLAMAHGEGIIHRDIKPGNLFLLGDGTVKVLDFGVARLLERTRIVHTELGTALGTPTYMPPEQARGEAIDGRADLFSLGGTLFRAITRKRIHTCNSDVDLLVKMATVPAPPLASIAPHVSEDVCLVVDRALAFRRGQRYPHARVMQMDVVALLEGRTPPYAAKRAKEDPISRTSIPPSDSASTRNSRTRAEVPSAKNLIQAEVPSTTQPRNEDANEPIPLVHTAPTTHDIASTPLTPNPPLPVQPIGNVPRWIVLLLASTLVLLVVGTLGGWWLIQSFGTP